MDLDKLKSSWQTADVKPAIDKEKIQRIINRQGESAFNTLLRTERVFIILLITCELISFTLKDQICFIIYFISGFIAIGWQTYKYSFLRKLEFAKISLLEVASKISTYKKYIYYEILVGSIWGLAFILLWIVRVVARDMIRLSSDHTVKILPLLFVFLGITLFLGLSVCILYKFLYLRKIKIINKAIREAQEVADFERDERV